MDNDVFRKYLERHIDAELMKVYGDNPERPPVDSSYIERGLEYCGLVLDRLRDVEEEIFSKGEYRGRWNIYVDRRFPDDSEWNFFRYIVAEISVRIGKSVFDKPFEMVGGYDPTRSFYDSENGVVFIDLTFLCRDFSDVLRYVSDNLIHDFIRAMEDYETKGGGDYVERIAEGDFIDYMNSLMICEKSMAGLYNSCEIIDAINERRDKEFLIGLVEDNELCGKIRNNECHERLKRDFYWFDIRRIVCFCKHVRDKHKENKI